MGFKKICIIHLNQIGDLVFSLPLLKALKDNHPDASIHSVVKPYLQELLSASPYVDKVIPRERGLLAKKDLLKHLRYSKYDLLISLARSEECLILTALSQAGTKAGFAHFPWDICLDIKEKIEGHNSCYNNAKLLKRLKIDIGKNDYVGLLNLGGKGIDLRLPEKFVVVSPGASRRRLAKTWDQEKFAELILLLKDNYGLTPVIVGGADNPAGNNELVGYLKAKVVDDEVIPFVDLTGKIGLRALCSVIKGADLFVGIDSGTMHLAAALDIPVVGLFGPTDPFYVGPQNDMSIVVREEQMQCVPCYLKDCKHRDCMRKLDAHKVFDACRELLPKRASCADRASVNLRHI